MEEFINTFDMMLHQEHVKHIISGVSMGGYSLSILVKIKSIVKLANTSYHSLCTPGALTVICSLQLSFKVPPGKFFKENCLRLG